MPMVIKVGEPETEPQRHRAGLSFLFPSGMRPSLAVFDRLLSSPELAGPPTVISHRAPIEEGWFELLVSGLTFEIHGLAPAPPIPVTPPRFKFGLGGGSGRENLEALNLVPAPHIAGGSAMIPVVRTITSLAANLTFLLPMTAVCWEPTESWMEPQYFARVIVNWLSGGPFPALGLTGLDRHPDGNITSVGLRFFCGQEIQVNARDKEPPAETAKLAIRVIDHIIRIGTITSFTELDSPSGETILAEPSRDGKLVQIWRGR